MKLLDSTLDENKAAGAVLVVDLYTNTGDLLEAFLTKRVSSNTPWFFCWARLRQLITGMGVHRPGSRPIFRYDLGINSEQVWE